MNSEKLVICIIDQGAEPDFMEVLAQQGLEHWTRIHDCSGIGRTGPREGNPVWPGLNTLFLIVMPPEKVQPLVDRMHQVRDSFPITPGMRFIVTDAVMM